MTKDFDHYKQIVADLRKRAEIRQEIRSEDDRIAAQLTAAADAIMELLEYKWMYEDLNK